MLCDHAAGGLALRSSCPFPVDAIEGRGRAPGTDPRPHGGNIVQNRRLARARNDLKVQPQIRGEVTHGNKIKRGECPPHFPLTRNDFPGGFPNLDPNGQERTETNAVPINPRALPQTLQSEQALRASSP
jgi:hypothetical protein